ncbi:molybdopterin adenylyltransferase [Verrucomicrobium sp. GAS474]|uniref:molybdopterin adenylyltransferase n=1 Tax=Verrucomicrobium sp. GAS474 TaxID=1882831 RepID=UPI00087D8734|nr:molybdopterin adenylyltransferase [Verrucomicrobium sp. GAS474]SDT89543.1 molybdopterin adenylyltransferase [Verrucomicrobium sp. GAS474]
MKIGRITLSDRASSGLYEDQSGPEIERVISACFDEPVDFVRVLMPDDLPGLTALLKRLADDERLPLVVTTGGTGPAPRDITPEATRAVLEKELPGFGELMRRHSYDIARVPTALLSRATAGIRGGTLIVNLPGKPRAIGECLPPLLPAIAECLEHISGFRPKLR